MQYTIKLFLKLGSEENILDLFENGTIYMNTIEYFRKVEDEELKPLVRELLICYLSRYLTDANLISSIENISSTSQR